MSKIVIDNGELRAIYADALLPYIDCVKAEFGLPNSAVTIRRATHVEPAPGRTHGGNWMVDLSPAGGPICYTDETGRPFKLRQDAIDFELRWLDANWLSKDSDHARSKP